MHTRWMVFLLTLTAFTWAQYQPRSPYLQDPDRIFGYIDSCAVFWHTGYDNSRGGFYTNINRQGNVYGGTAKDMLTQSRNAYGQVRAFMLTGDTTYLGYARGALDFMYAGAWDGANGGWYRSMDANGNPTTVNEWKTAFYQHYALVGISAYAEATGDTAHWSWLHRGYAHNDAVFWDDRPDYFGYWDESSPDGSQVRNKTFNATVDAITTHLLTLYLQTGDSRYMDRLQAMADNSLDHLVASMSSQAIGFAEKYNDDWVIRSNETLTIMGHVLKTAWCLGRIHMLAPDQSYVDGAELLVEDVLNLGYDHEYGGPYKDYNRITGEMQMWGNPDTAKAWWQMQQAVMAGMQMYYITEEDRYLEMADESLDFFMRHFVDHTFGEVYENRERSGPLTWGDQKGGGGKAGYHSIELGYYTYLYAKLFYHRDPVTLHYRFAPLDNARDIALSPLAIPAGALAVQSVTRDGQPYTDVDYTGRVLHLPAGTGGHFTVTYAPVLTAIADRGETHLPGGIALHANYPNPFNPTTRIPFELADSAPVRMTVFNVRGQEIATLVEATLAAGAHEVTWDGRDGEGRPVGSGLYLYELRTGDERQVRRMILLR